jgi:hypothetical protein
LKTAKHKEYLDLNLVDEIETRSMIYRLYEGRVFHAIIKSGEKISMEMTVLGYEFLNKHGGGRFYNLYEFETFAEMDPEVRTWAADTSGNNCTYVDAVVISNFAQKIIANFYIKFNKPKMPTKVFPSTEKALEWILSVRKDA